jgi:hypothetical protein
MDKHHRALKDKRSAGDRCKEVLGHFSRNVKHVTVGTCAISAIATAAPAQLAADEDLGKEPRHARVRYGLETTLQNMIMELRRRFSALRSPRAG